MGRKILVQLLLMISPALCLGALEIHDSPMKTSFRPPPAHLMFILDDSETMAREIHLENHEEGLFQPEGSSESFGFIFDDGAQRRSKAASTLSDAEKPYWRLRSAAFNTLYYDPFVFYRPWPATENFQGSGNASPLSPRTAPPSDKTLALLDPFMELASAGVSSMMIDDDFAVLGGFGWIREESPQAFGNAFHRTTSPDAKAVFTFELSGTGEREIRISWPAFGEGSPLAVARASIRVLDHQKAEIANFLVDQGNAAGKIFSVRVRELNPSGPDLFIEITHGFTGEESLLLVDTVVVGEAMILPNAHYFLLDDGDGSPDAQKRAFLVSFSLHGGLVHRKIHEISPQNTLEPGLVRGIAPADLPENLRLLYNPENSETFLAPEEDLQNFSNWFQYYRNKFLVMQSGLVHLAGDFSHVNPGFLTFSGNRAQAVVPMASSPDAAKKTFLASLYALQVDRDFPGQEKDTAKALGTVGKYLAKDLFPQGFADLANSPWFSEEDGGACQHAFALLLTDGLDGGETFPQSLVATAREFYERDLAPDLPDLLAASASDPAIHQHLVTSALIFGTRENSENTSQDPSASIDDDPLFPATFESRGLFEKTDRTEPILSAMRSLLSELEMRAGSGTSAEGTAGGLQEGKIFFRTEFDPLNWSGDLEAFPLDPRTGTFSADTPLWSAAEELASTDSEDRFIVSALGAEAFAFRMESIPLSLKGELLADAALPPSLRLPDLVNYIRGENIEGFRQRPLFGDAGRPYANKLGDIVNSTPRLHRGILYLGANDGMLHAFKADTGGELFAFLPSFVYPNLGHLTQKEYADHHRYFVDGPITIQSTASNGKTRDLLVGGLGKGGKGYYGLSLKNAFGWEVGDAFGESALAANLDTWEFPPPETRASEKDMGFSYSKAAVVRSNLASHPWIVVFGNGYASSGEEALLFILDAFTGEEIRRIRTGIKNSNGLSSPALVDTDKNGTADWAYAGDLHGNLWKFDISSAFANDWQVFFKENSLEKPLFTGKSPGGTSQPITTKPTVTRHCSGTGYMILWGTGRYLGLSDLEDFTGQTLYGVWDYGGKSTLGTLERKERANSLYALDPESSSGASLFLVRQTIEAASFSMEEALYGDVGEGVFYPVASHTRHPQVYTWKEKGKTLEDGSTAGWFFDLPERGERMVQDTFVADSAIVGVSFIPTCINEPCAAGGHSWINALDLCSGSRLPQTFFDINADKNASATGTSENLGDSLLASGMVYEVSRLQIPAGSTLVGTFSGDGSEALLILDAQGGGTLPLVIQGGGKDKIFYWRVR